MELIIYEKVIDKYVHDIKVVYLKLVWLWKERLDKDYWMFLYKRFYLMQWIFVAEDKIDVKLLIVKEKYLW
jgi:hypothetical protein